MSARIKKVSPYPITATLTWNAEAFQGKIGKLTSIGTLVETDRPLGLGRQFGLSFTLPVLNKAIQTVGVVIKTYARYGGEPGKAKSHTINEIHFKGLSDEHRISIQSFLVSIRQI